MAEAVLLTVTLALFLAAYGYQRMRFNVLDSEDAVQLSKAHAGNVDAEWLTDVKQQLDRGLVSPETIRELITLGLLSQSECNEGLEKSLRSYRPSAASFALRYGWLFIFGGFCGLVCFHYGTVDIASHALLTSVVLGIFFGSVAAVTTSDMQFRIIPIPFLCCFAVTAPFAFGSSLGWYCISSAVFAAALYVFVKVIEKLKKKQGLIGLGDILLMAVSVGALFATKTDSLGLLLGIWLGFLIAGSLVATVIVFAQTAYAAHKAAESNSITDFQYAVAATIFGVGLRGILRSHIPAGPIYTWSLGLVLVCLPYLS